MRRSRWFFAALSLLVVVALPMLAFGADGDDLFTRTARDRGWLAGLPVAFLGGLLTAGTGCVYPMIAITVSIFGARESTTLRAFALSGTYVHGIAAVAVPLGVIAALSGGLYGGFAGSPVVVIAFAAVMFAMAASMFGLFDIALPGSLQNRLATVGGKGLGGAFLLGMILAPLSAPCAGPIVLGILTWISQTRSVGAGALAMYAYSLGLGLPFLIVGTFAASMPKPGPWMDAIKSIAGVVLVIVGLNYLHRLVPALTPTARLATLAPFLVVRLALVALVVAGLAVGAVHLSLKYGTWPQRARKIAGILAVAVGALWLVNLEPPRVHAAGGACSVIAWQRDLGAARAVANREQRPMVIDFGATWCHSCEVLAREVFTAHEVECAARTQNFVTVKLYEDEDRPANWDALQTQYNIRGLPTVIVLDARGHEVARITGEVRPAEMVRLLNRVDAQHSSR